jgi:hypothetical protein
VILDVIFARALSGRLKQAKNLLAYKEGTRTMKITREEVQHVARLARLDLADTVLDTMAEQLGGILDYM